MDSPGSLLSSPSLPPEDSERPFRLSSQSSTLFKDSLSFCSSVSSTRKHSSRGKSFCRVESTNQSYSILLKPSSAPLQLPRKPSSPKLEALGSLYPLEESIPLSHHQSLTMNLPHWGREMFMRKLHLKVLKLTWEQTQWLITLLSKMKV